MVNYYVVRMKEKRFLYTWAPASRAREGKGEEKTEASITLKQYFKIGCCANKAKFRGNLTLN